MKSDIILSYVIPLYNHEKFIERTLDSIRLDGDELACEYEIVIIDDGSTDRSSVIVEQWINEHVNVRCSFYKQENKGISVTLNNLYSLAKGDFVRSCSSDDLIVEGSSSLLIKNIRDNVACIFGDGIVIDNSGILISESSIMYHRGRKSYLIDDSKINEELINRWCIAGPSILLRKQFIRKFRYDESARIDDIDLFLTLLMNYSVQYIDAVVCKYRVHLSNTSKTKDISARVRNLQSFGALIDKHTQIYPHGPLRRALVRQGLKNKAKISFLRRDYFSACRCIVLYWIKKYWRGF